MRYHPSMYLPNGSVNNPRVAPRPGEVGIEVIEVDQWTACDIPKNVPFDSLTHDSIHGRQSDGVARALFGGAFTRMIVSPNASPIIGDVWFRKDNENGFAVVYKANYDSSG